MQSRNIKIQGIPVYQVCNNTNDILRCRYEKLDIEEATLRREIEEKEARIAEIRKEYRDLNIAEAYNVIDYVRSYYRAGKIQDSEVDSLLCHCQNKLNGNINSVFLRFDNPMEEKRR